MPRALSYGTIYTTKLLRRGTDIDRAAPWRALQDLKVTDVTRPFRPALSIPPNGKALSAADGKFDAVRLDEQDQDYLDPAAAHEPAGTVAD